MLAVNLLGSPSFRYLDVNLQPGDSIMAESGSMTSMSSELSMETLLNGGFFRALARKFLGGESLFINIYSNQTQKPLNLKLTQGVPGDIKELTLNGETIFFEPGSYVCSTSGIQLGIRWAGFSSFIAREGLFKLAISGTGTVWFGGYGQILEKELNGEFIVDSGHLVGYEPHIKLKLQLPSGLFGSFFSGEGFVSRLEGRGKIYLQTRSISGLAAWVNSRW